MSNFGRLNSQGGSSCCVTSPRKTFLTAAPESEMRVTQKSTKFSLPLMDANKVPTASPKKSTREKLILEQRPSTHESVPLAV